jgi:hypothetical protein
MDGSTLFLIIIGFIALLVVAGVVANQREREALSKMPQEEKDAYFAKKRDAAATLTWGVSQSQHDLSTLSGSRSSQDQQCQGKEGYLWW